jgi:hypothetical protein
LPEADKRLKGVTTEEGAKKMANEVQVRMCVHVILMEALGLSWLASVKFNRVAMEEGAKKMTSKDQVLACVVYCLDLRIWLVCVVEGTCNV